MPSRPTAISMLQSVLVGAIKVNDTIPLVCVAKRNGPIKQTAITPLTACRPIGSVCLAIWLVTSMKKEKMTATNSGRRAGALASKGFFHME